MTLGERISARLELLGMSQSELARRVGVAQSSINSLIHRNKVGSKYLHKIAQVLQTTTAYLTGEIDDPSPDAPPPGPHMTPEETEFLRKLRRLSPADRETIERLTRSLGRAGD